MIGFTLWMKLKTCLGYAPTAETGPTTSSSTETEFSAEVVRVTRVLLHPNADRLAILRFEMAKLGETTYEVVSQKGQFKVGDLAAYFSVDCLLPTSHSDFKFLTERLDGAGKDLYRLRAARLRGVFSQGLLVPCPSGKSFGADVASHFGVTYYQAPVPGSAFTPGAKNKTERKQPFPIYGVDSLKKMPRLFEEGERVVITEKIHGTNFRFGWVRRKVFGIPFGWKFVVGSHRTIRDGQPGYYGEDIYSQYAESEHLAERTKLYKGHTVYGELYGHTYSGAKIQPLTYATGPADGPRLAVFDVIDDRGKYMDPFTRLNLCVDLNLEHVPVVSPSVALTTREFHLDEVKRLAEGKSLLAPLQIREGVVVESVDGPRRKAKYVSQQYLMSKEAQQ